MATKCTFQHYREAGKMAQRTLFIYLSACDVPSLVYMHRGACQGQEALDLPEPELQGGFEPFATGAGN